MGVITSYAKTRFLAIFLTWNLSFLSFQNLSCFRTETRHDHCRLRLLLHDFDLILNLVWEYCYPISNSLSAWNLIDGCRTLEHFKPRGYSLHPLALFPVPPQSVWGTRIRRNWILVVLAVIINSLWLTLEPILFCVVSRPSKAGKRFHLNLKRALLAQCLRIVLQLHRIAIERTYGYRLSNAASHEAPIYGVKAEDEVAEEEDDREVFPRYESNPLRDRVLYSTMLETEEDGVEDYNIRYLR